MKRTLICVFISVFVFTSSFAVKRKAALINQMPRFVLHNVDNRTMSEASIINNTQLIPLTRGNNAVFLPIDFTPSDNNPQLERSKPIPIALNGFFDETSTDLLMFSINKRTTPTESPHVQSIVLRALLTNINNQDNSVQHLQTQDYFYKLHRADQDNYLINITIDGPHLNNSSFTLQRYVTRGQD